MRARPRLTYANVVSTLALVIAMSTGGAYAASQITTSQIADEAVTTRKLHSDAVRSSKIDEGAVTRTNLASEAVSSSKLAPGAVTSSRLGTNAVTGTKIADGEITGADILQGSINFEDVNFDLRRPRAFGRVSWDGQVPNSYRSSNFSQDNVTMPADEDFVENVAGIFCIQGLDFTPQAISVTADVSQAGPGIAMATPGAGFGCPVETTQATVNTFDLSSANWAQQGKNFLISMWP